MNGAITCNTGFLSNVPNDFFIKARNDNAFYIYFQIKNVNYGGPVTQKTHRDLIDCNKMHIQTDFLRMSRSYFWKFFFQVDVQNEEFEGSSSEIEDHGLQDLNAERDEFDDYTTSQGNNDNNVDIIYCRENCKVNRLSLMVFGDSRAGKTRLVDCLTNTTHSESENREPLRIVECTVSINKTEITWNIPKDPFYQRVNQESIARFSPEGSNQSHAHETPNGINDIEVKIWDVSGNCGAYNSHKVFLAPSSMCLLILNVENGLHEVPEGGSREHTRSPLESLDHWLCMIDMCTSHDKNEGHSECAIIVLTHTDLINETQRERKVEEYKKEIMEHVQSKYICKYVHSTVFALGDGNEKHNELYCLQKVIVEKFLANHCEGATDNKPWSHLKLEAGILKFFAENDRRYLSLEQLIFSARKSYGMSMENLKSFLQFHLQYRNFIFDESALDLLDNVYDTNVSDMITDPLLIEEIFSAIVSLWEQRDLPVLSLRHRQKVDMDVKRHLIALNTLEYLCKLNSIQVTSVVAIAELLVSFNLLIPHRSFNESHTEKKYIVPAVMSTFVGDPVYNIFRERVNLWPLIFWFDQSSDFHSKEVSGFTISELFLKFISLQRQFALQREIWELVHMHSDAAAFRCGPQGQILAHITCQSCAIVLKLACIPNSMPENPGNLIPQIRRFVEGGIQVVIEDIFPGLQCSVCVSPCDAIKYECLSRLGDVGSEINQLRFAVCSIHGKTLNPDAFSRWFYPDSGQQNLLRETLRRKRQEQKDLQTLNNLAEKIGDKSTLISVALALQVPKEQVDMQMQNSPNDFRAATFNVLFKDWYHRVPGYLNEGSDKNKDLQLALEECSLAVYQQL